MTAGSDPPPDDEPTFADVLNGLTFGGRANGRSNARSNGRSTGRSTGRRRGRRGEPGDLGPPVVALPLTPPDAVPEAAGVTGATGVTGIEETGAAGEVDVDDVIESAAIVRPYAWTRGRTRSTVELQVETLVSAAEPPGASAPPEHRSIAELCRLPHSVAEVAALLGVPLGVAKVLIGDMAQAGLLTVHRTAGTAGSHAQLMLMERVLSGLRRL